VPAGKEKSKPESQVALTILYRREKVRAEPGFFFAGKRAVLRTAAYGPFAGCAGRARLRRLGRF
jgi:hypothetical protein